MASRAGSGLLKLTWFHFLVVAACVQALVFQLTALHTQSLTGDGAHHLLAGHQALRYGQNTLNLEHPPLTKLLAAFPLWLRDDPLAPPLRAVSALAMADRVYENPGRLLPAAVEAKYLFMVFVVLPFFAAAGRLGSHTGRRSAGIFLFLLLAFSFQVLPNLTLLQTDTAVALCFLLVLLAARGFQGGPTWQRALFLGGALGLGLATKFSAVLLLPAVFVAWVLSLPMSGSRSRAIGHGLAILAAAWLVLDGVYLLANHSYERELGRQVIQDYCQGKGTVIVEDRLHGAEEWLLGLERIDPFLAQWATGLLAVQAQNQIGVYASFAFGEIRSDGRWWYFPVLFLVKTPIAILLAMAAAAWVLRDFYRRSWKPWLPAMVTVVVYGVAAVLSSYNLGIRHLLPILPLLYLPIVAIWIRRPLASAALVAVLFLESLALEPLWMSHTNTWWLGDRDPFRHSFAAGNLEYRQNFFQLARQSRQRGIEGLRVLYPTLDATVLRAYLADATLVGPEEPVPPGWYAVNVTVEQLVPALLSGDPESIYDYESLRRAAVSWEPVWKQIRQGEDHGYLAETFHLYRVR